MFDQEKLDSCTAAKEFRACLFGLCFFHSLVLGRRRFGQLGWSRSYGFTAGDLNICANILQSYWEVAVSPAGRGAPWQELRYIFGEIMYGGHITDFFDRRVTISYLEVRLRGLFFIWKDEQTAFACLNYFQLEAPVCLAHRRREKATEPWKIVSTRWME